jgi:hypothetical protein
MGFSFSNAIGHRREVFYVSRNERNGRNEANLTPADTC